jgi:hypothetical protein
VIASVGRMKITRSPASSWMFPWGTTNVLLRITAARSSTAFGIATLLASMFP